VLQAMILTDGSKMALTPTYHIFHMYFPFPGFQIPAAGRADAGLHHDVTIEASSPDGRHRMLRH
jgi:hypothetical protein